MCCFTDFGREETHFDVCGVRLWIKPVFIYRNMPLDKCAVFTDFEREKNTF